MNFDFSSVLAKLGPNYVFDIANGATPPSAYLFATLLPEIQKPTYEVKSGYMIVRSTMAGLSGMDSPYPPTGVVQSSNFSENTAKIANQVPLSEASLRQLQQMIQLQSGRNATPIDLAQEALNFLNKVIIQAHLDTAEYLRASALLTGGINWTFNQKTLTVDYGIPSANMLTPRTGTNAYYNTASKFWADIALIRKLLKNNVRAVIAHPYTIDQIISNPANSLAVLDQSPAGVTVQKYVALNGVNVPSTDAREKIQLIAYAQEAEILDPTNPGNTIFRPFMTPGLLLGVGNNTSNGYQPGMGGTLDPLAALALGYTHLAPTVEGGNQMGRWADLYTPQDQPWQLVGRGVTNLLPVIEAPQKIVVATTDMQ